MLKKEARKITGGLSAPGKMPEGSYNLPATACQTGQLLAKVKGTPCSGCYALKGRYRFPNVKEAILSIKNEKTLITGSFYTVSEARAYFKLEGYSEL